MPFLDAQASLAPTPVCPSHFQISILSASRALTKHWDDIVVADDIKADMVAGMVVDKVADMAAKKKWSTFQCIEFDMVADMEEDMLANKVDNMVVDMVADMVANMVEDNNKNWQIRPKFFWPEAYPACASSKFISSRVVF